MIIKWNLLINANKKRKRLHRILKFYSWHSFGILLVVRNENFQFILFKQFSGTEIRAKSSLLSVGCRFPPWYLMAVCYLWLWFGLLLCMVYGLALCFWEFPNGVWNRPRFSFEMLKNAPLCVVFYFLYPKHFRNCFPHALMEKAQAMLIHVGKCLWSWIVCAGSQRSICSQSFVKGTTLSKSRPVQGERTSLFGQF